VRPRLENVTRTLGITLVPGNLAELFDMLAQMQTTARSHSIDALANALEQALNEAGYFDLLAPYATEIEAKLADKLAFVRLGLLSHSEKSEVALRMKELSNFYDHGAARHNHNALWFKRAAGKSQVALWSWLVRMHTDNAEHFKRLPVAAFAIAK
jgi:hypothetical protein